MKHLLIVALSILTIVSCNSTGLHNFFLQSLADKPAKTHFKFWWYLMKKPYDINSEIGLQKYRVFKANLKYIEEQNKKNQGFELGVGPYTDMTFEEFSSMFAKNEEKQIKNEIVKNIVFDKYEENAQLKQVSTDWTKLFGPVRDQKTCASLAYPIVEIAEAFYMQKYNIAKRFSVQHYIDCDYGECGAKKPYEFYIDFWTKNGLFLESEYPSTGVKGVCQISTSDRIHKCETIFPTAVISGYEKCERFSSNECNLTKLNQLIAKAPFITEFPVSQQFQNYKAGILEWKCDSSINSSNTYPLTVQINNTEKYFKLRNTFGTQWGEAGYARVKIYPEDDYERKYCGPNTLALYPQNVSNK